MQNLFPVIDLIHPTGNQNVRQVLQALSDNNNLGSFHTTLGFSGGALTGYLPKSVRTECARRTYSLPANKMRTRPFREVVRLIAQKWRIPSVVRHEQGWACVDAVYRDLDRAAARVIARSPRGLRGVYGYEDGCLETFRAAKSKGISCVYDLPIAHWALVRQLLTEERERTPEWEPTLIGTRDSPFKLERKAEELALADTIICPSQFVLASLPAEVRRGKRCLVAEFGSPSPVPDSALRRVNSAKLRVLFVGSMTQRKGLADLFSAIKLLGRSDVELVVLGSPVAAMEFYRRQLRDFTFVAPRSHGEVLEVMSTCDVLVLPSLVEGRALVQQEAMSRGLPLIITRNTGGEDLIVTGETGFLVPMRDPPAIAEKIGWLADHRSALPTMRSAVKKKAAEYSWQRYRQLVLAEILESATAMQQSEKLPIHGEVSSSQAAGGVRELS